MFNYTCFIIGLVVLGFALYAFKKTKDALHPAVFTAPLFIYFFSVWPLILNQGGDLMRYFSMSQLDYVMMLYFLSIVCLYAGMMKFTKKDQPILRENMPKMDELLQLFLTPFKRKRIYNVSLILGFLALVAYWYSLSNAGGFVRAYSHAKGGGWASSGYIGEAILFSFSAIILLAISRQGKKIRSTDIFLALIMASPHLFQGTFGGRRGPLFLILSTLFIAWFIAKGALPSFKRTVTGVSIVCIVVLLVWSQRQHLYLSSGGEFQSNLVFERVNPGIIAPGNEFVVGVGTVITADVTDHFYWGYRYFVTFFIRPIPKQIWPSKYKDMGADWLYRYGDEERTMRYFRAVGFVPLSGSSTGYIADAYTEFYWGVLLFSYLLGRGFCMLWERHRLRGGLWTILFVESLILSIYLPTQSFTAFFHRFLFMAGVTIIAWKYWIQVSQRTHQVLQSHNKISMKPN